MNCNHWTRQSLWCLIFRSEWKRLILKLFICFVVIKYSYLFNSIFGTSIHEKETIWMRIWWFKIEISKELENQKEKNCILSRGEIHIFCANGKYTSINAAARSINCIEHGFALGDNAKLVASCLNANKKKKHQIQHLARMRHHSLQNVRGEITWKEEMSNTCCRSSESKPSDFNWISIESKITTLAHTVRAKCASFDNEYFQWGGLFMYIYLSLSVELKMTWKFLEIIERISFHTCLTTDAHYAIDVFFYSILTEESRNMGSCYLTYCLQLTISCGNIYECWFGTFSQGKSKQIQDSHQSMQSCGNDSQIDDNCC